MLFHRPLHSLKRRALRGHHLPDVAEANAHRDPAEVPADRQAIPQQDIEEIWQLGEKLYASGMHPMVSMCLRRGGEMLLNRCIGYAGDFDSPTPRPATLDTPVCLFSASKVVAAALVHKLAEEGKINLLHPVSYYIPQFAQGGKANITIYQLLCHRAGVPGVPSDVPVETLYDREKTLEIICRQKALDIDGRVVAYHALTGGFILAELIRVVTGLDINQYNDRVFRKPLGMRYFSFGLPERDHAKVAENMITGLPNVGPVGWQLEKVLGAKVDEAVKISNYPEFLSAQVPSGNLYATAEEACRFFEMLVDNGHWQGQSVMSPMTVNQLTREAAPPQFDRSLGFPIRYSAGAMLGGRVIGMFGRHSANAFGHLGFSNIFCWADPERNLSVSILTSGKPVIGNHIATMLSLIDTVNQHCYPCVDMEAWRSQRPSYDAAAL